MVNCKNKHPTVSDLVILDVSSRDEMWSSLQARLSEVELHLCSYGEVLIHGGVAVHYGYFGINHAPVSSQSLIHIMYVSSINLLVPQVVLR